MDPIQLVNSGVTGKLVEFMRDRKIEGKDAVNFGLGTIAITTIAVCFKYAVDHNYHFSEAKSHEEANEVNAKKSVKPER